MQSQQSELTLAAPDDFHLHLRQGDALPAYARDSAEVFARAMIMPNTLPPVTSVDGLTQYRDQIRSATADLDFEPLMTFKLLPGLSPEAVTDLQQAGAIAGKYYPQGATTNAEDGSKDIRDLYPVFARLEELGLVLSIHGEDPDAPMLEREAAFLPQLRQLVNDFPRLSIVLEHISTAAGITLVESLPQTVAGTITAHHLVLSVNEVLGRPHNLCMPVAKQPADRTAIRRAAVSGNPKFFFGSDSAPHLREKKECATPACGIYTAPVILPTLAEVFEEEEALERLEDFASRFGAQFYGLPVNPTKITLTRKEQRVPEECHGVVPFRSGEALRWSVQ